MSDDPIETNDNEAACGDDLAAHASTGRDRGGAQPRLARAAGGRFAPGQSGNRRGRPRKQPEPVNSMMVRVLNEAVQLNRGGKPVEMSCAEAIFRSLCHKGMTDPRVGEKVLKLVAAREAVNDPGEIDVRLAQSQAVLESYVGRMRRQIAAELTMERGAGDNDNPEPAADPEEAS